MDWRLSFSLFGVRLSCLAPSGPFEQRQSSQSRLDFLSFALRILSLYSYANRLLTFVKTKWHDDERRGNRKVRREREKETRWASKPARNNSLLSSFFSIVGYPQLFLSLHLFFFFLLVFFFFFSFLRDTAILCNFYEIFRWQMSLKPVQKLFDLIIRKFKKFQL